MEKKDKRLVRIKRPVKSISSALNASEFHWPTVVSDEKEISKSSGDQKNTVNDLIGALKRVSSTTIRTKLGNLKKHLSTAYDRRPKPLHAPLQDRERERVEREVAYGEISKEISDWDEIVEKNRLADKLTFPLYSEPLRFHTIEEKIVDFQPQTTLEIETAKILSNSKNNLRNSDPLTEAEKEALKAMSLDEAKERRAKLQKMRALVSYAERKIRWQNRIKSKRYRRLLKKQDRKKAEKEFQELLDKDPAAALEKLEFLERDRIKERASLKHRSTGKWAKQVRHLAKKDPRLREALQEQLRKGRDLAEKQRRLTKLVDEDEEDEDSEQSDGEMDVDNEGEKEKKKWANSQPILQTTPRLITHVGDNGDDDEPDGNDNLALMAEAFADDDVIEDFKKDLAADIDKDDAEATANLEAQLTVPGWNSWTGPGTEHLKSNRERRKRLEKLKSKRDKAKKRKLDNWPLVTINDSAANESVRKMQVSDLPFPFSSTRDFEANLEPPLGKEWNPESIHQSLIQPNLETKMGAIIKPISRDLALKKETNQKNRKPYRRTRKTEKKAKKGESKKMNTDDKI